jgi:predicted RNase H-like HicB family nuclease
LKRHQILLCWSEDDQLYVAQVPDLAGCMAHGKSEVEAVRSARQAIELYIEDLTECGEPVPEPSDYQLVPA